MTEREKLFAGLPFNTRDPELITSYTQARTLLRRYNTEAVDQLHLRQPILNELLGTPGTRNWIEAPFQCDYGKHIHLGTDIYIGYYCYFQDNHAINIGSGTLIGAHCFLATAQHPIPELERTIINPETGERTYTTTAAPIMIGENCWIGARVTIGSGVTIGHGCVIGAGSTVLTDLPPNTVCYGTPCKVIRSTEK